MHRSLLLLTSLLMFLAGVQLHATDVSIPKVSDAAPVDIDGDPVPAGAIARLGTKCFRPHQSSHGVGFLPDGRTVVQTASDGFLRYWDAKTGRMLREVRVSTHNISAASHTLDGTAIAARGFYYDEVNAEQVEWLAVFDATTGIQRMSLEADILWNAEVAISADARTVVVSGQTVRVFDVAAGAEVRNWQPAAGQIESVAFSPNGKILAMGDDRGNLRLWNWSTDEEPRKVVVVNEPRHSVSLLSLNYSPDGESVAVGSDSTEGVSLVSTASGEVIRRYSIEGIVHMYPRCVRFSPDGKLLAVTIDHNDGGGVALFDVESGVLNRRLTSDYGNSKQIAFSGDEKLLAAVSEWERTLHVWNIETGEPTVQQPPGHLASPSCIRFLPDEDILATTGEDSTIRIWNVAESRQLRTFRHEPNERGYVRTIRALDVSPDGRWLATSCLDSTVRIWEVASGKEKYRLPGHGQWGGRREVRFTPDGRRLVSWGDDQRVYIWDLATGKALQEYLPKPTGVTLPERMGGSLDELDAIGFRDGKLSPDASRLLLSLTSSHLFRVDSGEELAKFAGAENHLTGLAISPDNKYVLTSGWGKNLQVRMANGRMRSSTVKDQPLQLRNLETAEMAQETLLIGGGSSSVAFAPDSLTAAICVNGDGPRILLLQIPDLKELAVIKTPGTLREVEFSRLGKRLAASISDTTVLVWDLAKLKKEGQ